MMPGCKQQAMGNGNDTVSFHLLRGGFPPAAQWFPAIEPQAAKPEPQAGKSRRRAATIKPASRKPRAASRKLRKTSRQAGKPAKIKPASCENQADELQKSSPQAASREPQAASCENQAGKLRKSSRRAAKISPRVAKSEPRTGKIGSGVQGSGASCGSLRIFRGDLLVFVYVLLHIFDLNFFSGFLRDLSVFW